MRVDHEDGVPLTDYLHTGEFGVVLPLHSEDNDIIQPLPFPDNIDTIEVSNMDSERKVRLREVKAGDVVVFPSRHFHQVETSYADPKRYLHGAR